MVLPFWGFWSGSPIYLYYYDHSDRNIDYETKRLKAIEQKLGYKLIRIYPGKEHFDGFKAINEILRHIKQISNQLTKKSIDI